MSLTLLDDSGSDSRTRELLAFRLGSEEYGIDILKVQEIRSAGPITEIANTPPFIRGVIDLRGVIVPIVDLRIKFGLPNASYDQFTVFIILNVGARIIGAVVDSVSDVISVAPEQIKAVPEFSSTIDTQFIDGMATIDDRMIILVEIERLMLSPGMRLVDEELAK